MKNPPRLELLLALTFAALLVGTLSGCVVPKGDPSGASSVEPSPTETPAEVTELFTQQNDLTSEEMQMITETCLTFFPDFASDFSKIPLIDQSIARAYVNTLERNVSKGFSSEATCRGIVETLSTVQ